MQWNTVSGQVVTSAKINDINTFENPNKIRVEKFSAATKRGNNLTVELPAQSVVMLELK